MTQTHARGMVQLSLQFLKEWETHDQSSSYLWEVLLLNSNLHRKFLFFLLLFKASIFIVHCEASCSCSLVILFKSTAQNLQF